MEIQNHKVVAVIIDLRVEVCQKSPRNIPNAIEELVRGGAECRDCTRSLGSLAFRPHGAGHHCATISAGGASSWWSQIPSQAGFAPRPRSGQVRGPRDHTEAWFTPLCFWLCLWQQGTVMRSDGFGSQNRPSGGTWSRVSWLSCNVPFPAWCPLGTGISSMPQMYSVLALSYSLGGKPIGLAIPLLRSRLSTGRHTRPPFRLGLVVHAGQRPSERCFQASRECLRCLAFC